MSAPSRPKTQALLGARSSAPATAAAVASGRCEAAGWVGGLIGIVVIIVVWWIASLTLFQASHAIPSPAVGARLVLRRRAVGRRRWNNARRRSPPPAEGYLWGNLAAIALAVLVLLLPLLEQIVNQIAIVTYCIPLVAIGPILVIVAGRRSPQGASVVLAALSVFFTTVVGCLLGLRAAPRTSLDLVGRTAAPAGPSCARCS